MARAPVGRIAIALALVSTFAAVHPARAQLGVGTWVREMGPGAHARMTMIVDPCCGGGRRLTYRFGESKQAMVVSSAFDGREAEVLVDGKPSGETMAIKLVDPHHTSTIVKLNGKLFGTSKCAISPDGRKLTVNNDFAVSAGGNPAGKSIEIWLKK